jgi:uncharacterized RDD family membrane protein YckC
MAYQQPPWAATTSDYAVAQPAYANWLYRVGAYLIDAIVTSALIWIGFILISALGLRDAAGTPTGAGLVIYIVTLLASAVIGIWNTFIRQGRTGQSLGKQALGIRMISATTGQPIGGWMTFVRQLAHILDSLPCYIGWLWPIWDSRRQTFADKILGTVVVRA